MEPRKGDWIETYTGVEFWPLDPRPEEVFIADIAHALALQNRFNGHSRYPYTVAEHSCRIMDVLPRHLQAQGLMHDATEAYIPDLARPLKLQMPIFKEVEDYLWKHAIAPRFELEHWLDSQVKEADTRMLYTEARDLMHGSATRNHWWSDKELKPYPSLNLELPWVWERAEDEFLDRYDRLVQDRLIKHHD